MVEAKVNDQPPPDAVLRGALLWLRNHYASTADLKPDHTADMQPHVIARIDAVFKDHPPSLDDVKRFRRAYPRT
jgi:hypothetical protein